MSMHRPEHGDVPPATSSGLNTRPSTVSRSQLRARSVSNPDSQSRGGSIDAWMSMWPDEASALLPVHPVHSMDVDGGEAGIAEVPATSSGENHNKVIHMSTTTAVNQRYPSQSVPVQSDFDKQFQPDRFGDEASENARVWKVYRDRVTDLDSDLIEGWKDTLNFLLVFAGLFSAVATAFIIEYSRRLQPDYTEYTAKAMFVLLARMNDSTTPAVPLPEFNHFAPPLRARWINGVWFLSLTLALVISLLSILIKQWLVDYVAKLRAPVEHARRWAWRHFAYRQGLERWGVGPIVSGLTVLLHAALFLFLCGLIGFLFELDAASFWIMALVTAGGAMFYITATILPLWYADCPSTTPLLENIWSAASRCMGIFGRELMERRIGYDDRVLSSGHAPRRDAEVLSWMIESLPTGSDAYTAINAVGSLDLIEHHRYFRKSRDSVNPLASRRIVQAAETRLSSLISPSASSGSPALSGQISHALRSLLFLRTAVSQEMLDHVRQLRHDRTHDVHILSSLLCDRSDAQWQNTAENRWLHVEVLDRLAEWWMSDSLPSQLHPMVQPTRHLLLYDLLVVVTSGTHIDLTPLTVTAAGIPSLSRLSVVMMLANGELSSHSWASFLANTSSQAAAQIAPSRPAMLALLDRLSPTAPRRVHVIIIWAFVLERSQVLNLTPKEVSLLAKAYGSALMRIPLPTKTTPWLMKHVESCLACFAAPDLRLPKYWKDALVYRAASLLQRSFAYGRDRDTAWSAKLGSITFGTLHQLRLGGGARLDSDVMRTISQIFSRLNAGDSHHLALKALSRHGSALDMIQNTELNILLTRSRGSLGSAAQSSAWRLVLELCTEDHAQLANTAARLSVQLAILAHPLLESLLLQDDISHRLVEELAGDQRGIVLAVNDPDSFYTLAIHAKRVSMRWWQDIRPRLVGVTDEHWTTFGPNTTSTKFDTIDALLQAIDGAGSCNACTEQATDLARVLLHEDDL
ncbi:hypothetical protein BKA62DRAFT_785934 [Auriculariales sp. MPI-PUGE-AT-0066]|nr:hypothetical protein BKA62DRAFT_785934 [Auriculariales sp. MPI-PUGE-AT-0066]